MYDKRRRIHVTFNAAVLPIELDPDTYEDHLEFAVWYQLISSTRRSRLNRDRVRKDLSRYSLMQLRAIFLFAVFEHRNEIEKQDTLNELERAMLWDRLELSWLIEFDPDLVPVATDAAHDVQFEA